MDKERQTARLTGRWGEALAAEYLKKKGYRLVGMNYFCRCGEVDLIVEDRWYVVFVEVKLRRSDSFARASEFVDLHKQEKIRRTAGVWLSKNETSKQPRFAVVEIYAPQGMDTWHPTINHLEDAFQ